MTAFEAYKYSPFEELMLRTERKKDETKVGVDETRRLIFRIVLWYSVCNRFRLTKRDDYI